MGFELYFSDLTKDAQDRLMKCAGISDPKEANWDMDIHPITFLDFDNESVEDLNMVTYCMKTEISKLLHNLGISSAKSGYWYMTTAIEILSDKNVDILNIDIYKELAKRYNKRSTNTIKRSISEAISDGFYNGDPNLIAEVFGHSIDGIPKPLQLIRTIAEYMRLKY